MNLCKWLTPTLIIIIATLALGTFASCESDSSASGDAGRFPVRFNGGVSVDETRRGPGIDGSPTRAADNNWEANDQIGVYMVPHTANASDAADLDSEDYADNASNVPYVTSGTSFAVVTGSAPIYYPSSPDAKVNFVGYYPYKSDVHTNNHIYPVDVSTQAPLKDIDLLYHKGTGMAYSRSNADPIDLDFTHQLSKLLVSVKLDDGVTIDMKGTTASLQGFPTTAKFNLATGVLGNVGGVSEDISLIADNTDEQANYTAILVPHSGSGYTRKIHFTIAGKLYSYTFATGFNLVKGLSHECEFTFTGTKLELTKTTIDLLYPKDASGVITVTTSAASLTATLSGSSSSTTTAPTWLEATLSKTSTDPTTKWDTYSLTAKSKTFNITTSNATRTGYIHLYEGGTRKKVITVTQNYKTLEVKAPSPTAFNNVPAAGTSGKTFTITTNAQDANVTPTKPTWVTIESSKRGTVDTNNGSSTWTFTFNVSTNTATSPRSGDISVTIGGKTQTIRVSQDAMYVNAPSTAQFEVPFTATTGNTFTIKTNAKDETVTPTTSTWITIATSKRGSVDPNDGSSTWTFTFNVSENEAVNARQGTIVVKICGIEKTITVKQKAYYVNAPSPSSFELPAKATTGNSFSIKTNYNKDENVTYKPNTDMIMNLKGTRGDVGSDGSSIWTFTFDTKANATYTPGDYKIFVTFGKGIANATERSVSVIQRALFVNAPVVLFNDVPAAGRTKNKFTITTNVADENITVTNKSTGMISNITRTKDLPNKWGEFTWTFEFDVSMSSATSVRNGSIVVEIGDVKQTINVKQDAVYIEFSHNELHFTRNFELEYYVYARTNYAGNDINVMLGGRTGDIAASSVHWTRKEIDQTDKTYEIRFYFKHLFKPMVQHSIGDIICKIPGYVHTVTVNGYIHDSYMQSKGITPVMPFTTGTRP